MMADCNKMAGQDDYYYRHSFGIGAYSENFAQKKFGSKLEFVGVSKKNQGGFTNLGYIHLRMGH